MASGDRLPLEPCLSLYKRLMAEKRKVFIIERQRSPHSLGGGMPGKDFNTFKSPPFDVKRWCTYMGITEQEYERLRPILKGTTPTKTLDFDLVDRIYTAAGRPDKFNQDYPLEG
jgi:hypothetical protein